MSNAVLYISYLSLSSSWGPDLDNNQYRLPGIRVHCGCDRSTGDAYSFQAPYPISGLSRDAIFTLEYSIYLIWASTLTFDCSFYVIKTTGFNYFFAFESVFMAGLTNRQRVRTPPRQLISFLVYHGIRVCHILWFVFTTGLIRLMNVCYPCHFI
jgi:hypothetical protein